MKIGYVSEACRECIMINIRYRIQVKSGMETGNNYKNEMKIVKTT